MRPEHSLLGKIFHAIHFSELNEPVIAVIMPLDVLIAHIKLIFHHKRQLFLDFFRFKTVVVIQKGDKFSVNKFVIRIFKCCS